MGAELGEKGEDVSSFPSPLVCSVEELQETSRPLEYEDYQRKYAQS